MKRMTIVCEEVDALVMVALLAAAEEEGDIGQAFQLKIEEVSVDEI